MVVEGAVAQVNTTLASCFNLSITPPESGQRHLVGLVLPFGDGVMLHVLDKQVGSGAINKQIKAS